MSDKRLAFSSIVVTHTLRHEAFHVGVDGPIFGRHGIEARLRAQGRLRNPGARQRAIERLLDRVKGTRLASGSSPAKSRKKAASLSRPSSPSKTIPADAGGVGKRLANAT